MDRGLFAQHGKSFVHVAVDEEINISEVDSIEGQHRGGAHHRSVVLSKSGAVDCGFASIPRTAPCPAFGYLASSAKHRSIGARLVRRGINA
jgi:hypothetical protein